MDEYGKRLKRDADAIRAKVTPELRARIDASLEGVTPARGAERAAVPVKLWWASSLTGLAAAAVVIAIVNWNRDAPDTPPTEPVAGVTVPDVTVPVPSALEVRTADFVSPLEDELVRLRADIEKARESVREDLGVF